MRYPMTIDGQYHELLIGDPRGPTIDGLRPYQTCVLRVEAASNEAVEELMRAGFSFDDCRPASAD